MPKVSSCLFRRGQKGLGGVEKLNAGSFSGNVYPLESALRSSAAYTYKGKQILVTKVGGQFVQIRLESNRFRGAEIIGFRAAFLAEAAEIILPAEGAKETAAQMPGVRIIDGPDIDVLFLRALISRLQVRALREVAVEIIDSRRDHQNGTALGGTGRQAL